MLNINYQKRKNTELFKSLENMENLHVTDIQNYIPIYKKFFSLNETNYNNINLNHPWYISSVKEFDENDKHLFNCNLKHFEKNKLINKEVFFKLAPLLDPYKFLIGKYNINDNKIYNLPSFNSNENNCHTKYLDENNSAYVDGFFLFLSSKLKYSHKFLHSVDYYGSFLGIKNDFIVNIFDDIDYLNNSDFFIKNKNILFKVEDYEYLFNNENKLLKPITIEHNISNKSHFSIHSFNDEIYDNIFDDKESNLNNNSSVELIDILNENLIEKDNNIHVSLKSNSTCSSRSSYTDNTELCNNCDLNKEEDTSCESDLDEKEDVEEKQNSSISDSSTETDDEKDECIEAIIPKFPVQIIAMEYCSFTFDELILNNDLSSEEWYSALMQIIMILITYQKAFSFTHNDLHTNNVMFNETDKKYIFYCYKKKIYKVPTFGRIFKIIDFGRSIYKYDGKLFCSDSFQVSGDASTQYNTEPYLNEKKPRLEPNFSFDLCRLACSILDYIIEDIEEIKDLSKCKDPVKRLIVEWCLDDKGMNMLYKNNGADRYPEFKLYKMIARCVHNHTPQAQLERPEFDIYSKFKGEISQDIIDIDKIPSCI